MEVCGVKPSVDILGFKTRTDNFFVYLVGSLAITGFLFAVGQLFVVTSTWSLGITGTFLGDYFGILMDHRVEGYVERVRF